MTGRGLGVAAVEFGVGTRLLGDEDVDAELQNVVQLVGRELGELPSRIFMGRNLGGSMPTVMNDAIELYYEAFGVKTTLTSSVCPVWETNSSSIPRRSAWRSSTGGSS